MDKMSTLLKNLLRPAWYKLKELAYCLSYLRYKYFGTKPKILSFEETIQYIIKNRCSVSRFGDGEIVLMLKQQKIGFQDLVPQLSVDLLNSFKVNDPKVLICLKGLFFNSKFGSDERKFCEYYYFECYRHFLRHLNYQYVYGAADLTRFYEPSNWKWTDYDELERYVDRLKKIWEGQNVIFVEGKNTMLGIGNDLYDNVNSIRRILCPSQNAYSVKDQIYQSIVKNATEDDLVLLALGPTASVLAVELAVSTKLWVIDIGHVDVVYLWMKNRCKYKMNIEGKHVNEASEDAGIIPIRYNKDIYNSQIIDEVR